ncbi:putative 2OG Fe(II) oxygenase superfamily [Trypanosoma vivax]|nr:putative 2OG Fe(II) oxygenase superfamily [Trypanosoma vivax]
MFQRPIIGVERLPPLPNPEPSNINEFFFGYKNSTGITYCGGNETAESPTKGGSHARVLVCEAIRQIPGLYIVQEFLTPAEHDAVWEELRGSESNIEIENLARRDVAHFNRRFYYGVNRIGVEGVSVNKQPNFYSWMLQRLRNKDPSVGIRGFPTVAQSQNFDQLTVNFYNFGSCKDKTAPGIAHHVDSHSVFSECVMIVSLGSHTVMEFSHYSKPPDVEEPIGVLLTPRSLLIMTSEARYAWTHSIAEKRVDVLSDKLPRLRRGDRVSLTWRRGRSRPHRREECAWNRLCDGA